MKPYAAGRKRAAAETAVKAESEAPARKAAEERAPARPGGRHSLPEGSGKSRPKASGTYQGKH